MFFGRYTTAIYALERAKRSQNYALVGGYACRYWYDLYFPSGKRYEHKDLDVRGRETEAVVIAKKSCLELDLRPFLHNTFKYLVFDPYNMSDRGERVEIMPMLPVLDEREGCLAKELQGVVYRVPNNFDVKLAVSVLDPYSLFVAKYPAYLSDKRRSQPLRYHDAEHLEMLAKIIPRFFEDERNGMFEQIHFPKREVGTAAKRLYELIESAEELPKGVDRRGLMKCLRRAFIRKTPEYYGPDAMS